MLLRSFILAAVASALAPAAASGAVAGTPAPSAPGMLPTAWFEYGNDDIGIEFDRSPDDHRTSQMTAGAVFDDDIALVVDDSMLTDCGCGCGDEPSSRSDEITLTAGWLPWGRGVDDTAWAGFGLGTRLSGNLGGGHLQNDVHQSQGFVCYNLPYDHTAESGLAYACGGAPWWPTEWAGAEVQASALLTSYGEAQSELIARGVLRGYECRLWGGMRYEYRDGTAQDRTARTVATFERGFDLDYGIAWRHWSLSGGTELKNGHSYGRIALVVYE